MRRIIAGIFIALSLTGCATSEPREVTPQSCIVALDVAQDLFTYLGRGDVEGYVEYGRENQDRLQDATQDCRSKAVDNGQST